MKKIMVAIAAVALAGATQAAALNWNSKAFLWDKSTDAKATSITGGSIMLCLINDGADWTKGVTDLDAGVLVTSGMAAAIGKVKGSSEGSFGWSYADGTLKNGDVLTVLFKDTDGKYSQLDYVSGGKVTDTYTVSGLSGDSSVLTTFEFATAGNFTAVPEPTSGLLMLLGVAGLALRRRRA
ncbi:MAG: PEP-CTERM sorting domain-containing protein [Kiritimatiellae bacterium]|nr:PEP-CTERM sorting domain-containing protein [Kiritimatiellia bacterium]